MYRLFPFELNGLYQYVIQLRYNEEYSPRYSNLLFFLFLSFYTGDFLFNDYYIKLGIIDIESVEPIYGHDLRISRIIVILKTLVSINIKLL